MEDAQLSCKADTPDERDFDYVPPPELLAALPPSIDLRAVAPGFPEIYTQGRLNSCTAQAAAAALYFDMGKQRLNAFEPSRLFIYYNERYLTHDIGSRRYGNHGAPVQMRDCVKSISTTGFCSEAHWPYVETLFDTRPATALYDFAAQHCSRAYYRIAQELAHLKACLAEGYPFLCGIVVYESFLGPAVRETGLVSMPEAGEIVRGGHAVAVVGYDEARGHFIGRNSFGPAWGDAGHCYLPFPYFADADRAFDFWTIRTVGDGNDAGAPTPIAAQA